MDSPHLGYEIRESPKPKQISIQKVHLLLSMDKAIFQARYSTAPKFLYALRTFSHTKLHFPLVHQSSFISPHPLQVNAHQHSHHPCLRSNLNNFLTRNTTPKLIFQASLQGVSCSSEPLAWLFSYYRLEQHFAPYQKCI